MLTFNHHSRHVERVGRRGEGWQLPIELLVVCIFYIHFEEGDDTESIVILDSENVFHCFTFGHLTRYEKQLTPIHTLSHKLEISNNSRISFGKAITYPSVVCLLMENNGRLMHRIRLNTSGSSILQVERFSLPTVLSYILDIELISSSQVALLYLNNEFKDNTVESRGSTLNICTYFLTEKGRTKSGQFEIQNLDRSVHKMFSFYGAVILMYGDSLVLFDREGQKVSTSVPDDIHYSVVIRRISYISSNAKMIKALQVLLLTYQKKLILCTISRQNNFGSTRYSFSMYAETIGQVPFIGALHVLGNTRIDSPTCSVLFSVTGIIRAIIHLSFSSIQLLKVSIDNMSDSMGFEGGNNPPGAITHVSTTSYNEIICCSILGDSVVLNIGLWGYRITSNNSDPVPVQGLPRLHSLWFSETCISILSYPGKTILLSSENGLSTIVNSVTTLRSTHLVGSSDFILTYDNEVKFISTNYNSDLPYSIKMLFKSSEEVLFSEYHAQDQIILLITRSSIKILRFGISQFVESSLDCYLKYEPSCSYLFRDFLFVGTWIDNTITCFRSDSLELLSRMELDETARSLYILDTGNKYYLLVAKADGSIDTTEISIQNDHLIFNVSKHSKKLSTLPITFSPINSKSVIGVGEGSYIFEADQNGVHVAPILFPPTTLPGQILSLGIDKKFSRILYLVQDYDDSVIFSGQLERFGFQCSSKVLDVSNRVPIQIIQLGYLDVIITLSHKKEAILVDSELLISLRDGMRILKTLKLRDCLRTCLSVICRSICSVGQDHSGNQCLVAQCMIGAKNNWKCFLCLFRVSVQMTSESIDYALELESLKELGDSLYDNYSESSMNGCSMHSQNSNLVYVYNNQVHIAQIHLKDMNEKEFLGPPTVLNLFDFKQMERNDRSYMEQYLSRSSSFYRSLHFPIFRVVTRPIVPETKKNQLLILCSGLIEGLKLIEVSFDESSQQYTYREVANKCFDADGKEIKVLASQLLISATNDSICQYVIMDSLDDVIKVFELEDVCVTQAEVEKQPYSISFERSQGNQTRFEEHVDGLDYILALKNGLQPVMHTPTNDHVGNEGDIQSTWRIEPPRTVFKLVDSISLSPLKKSILVDCPIRQTISTSSQLGDSEWRRWLDVL